MIQPLVQFRSLGGVLFTGNFDPGLDLPDGNGGKVKIIGRLALDPIQDRLVRAGTAQLGDDIRVEEIHGPAHSKRGAGRRRTLLRGGVSVSVRASGASRTSLRFGRVIL